MPQVTRTGRGRGVYLPESQGSAWGRPGRGSTFSGVGAGGSVWCSDLLQSQSLSVAWWARRIFARSTFPRSCMCTPRTSGGKDSRMEVAMRCA
eukprot:8988245-Alexandrium_andersonii.AAC.1